MRYRSSVPFAQRVSTLHVVAGRSDLGRLLPGCVADLIVVSDIVARDEPDPAELASLRPSATLIDGELFHGELPTR